MKLSDLPLILCVIALGALFACMMLYGLGALFLSQPY